MAVDSNEDSLFPDLDVAIGNSKKISPATESENEGIDSELSVLTKAELVQRLAEVLGLSDLLCRKLVMSFFDTIKDRLVAGEDVKIAGLGSFCIREKGARPGRNPKTGEEVTITPRHVVSFKPSRMLRKQIDERHERNG